MAGAGGGEAALRRRPREGGGGMVCAGQEGAGRASKKKKESGGGLVPARGSERREGSEGDLPSPSFFLLGLPPVDATSLLSFVCAGVKERERDSLPPHPTPLLLSMAALRVGLEKGRTAPQFFF